MDEWIIQPEDSGSKLIAFLQRKYDGRYSARHLKKAIEHNRCQINDKTERFASTQLGKGDKVSFQPDDPLPKKQVLNFDRSRLLYEDSHLLAYDKPSGINSDEEGMKLLLQEHCPAIELVHRLDKETTGVFLAAKTKEAKEQLMEQFKKGTIKKCYRAIVDGVIREEKGVIDNFLGKKGFFAGQTIWGEVKKEGLHAYTAWKLLKKGKTASLVQCYPKTGRTHQIRVHMAEMGHPILGDHQYSKSFRSPYRPNRILLHAEAIQFLHPISGQLLTIKAPIPADFLAACRDLFR